MGKNEGSESGRSGKGEPAKLGAEGSASQGFANSDELLRLFTEVLLGDGEIDSAIQKMREGKPGWLLSARTKLSQRIAGLVGIEELAARVAALNSSVSSLKDDLQKYQSHMEKKVADLLPPGDLKSRYENEYPREKEAIAKHVCKVYFQSEQKCFLQASTFLLHLADELRASGISQGSVIHTNSTVFPWLLLGRGSRYSVYACCGQIHDTLCCGWLFASNDKGAQAHVRELFSREQDKLTTAFVTPQHLTLDGGLHFATEATANLVTVLVEAAPKVVVLSPAGRVRVDGSRLDQKDHVWYAVSVPDMVRQATTNGKSLDFVLSGAMHDGLRREELAQLRRFGHVTDLGIPKPTNGGLKSG